MHLDPRLRLYQVQRQLQLLKRQLNPFSNLPIFFGGDFNFVDPDEGRIRVADGLVHCRREDFHAAWHSTFPNLCELAQPDPTRRRVEDGRVSVLSRLDRWFTTLPMVELSDVEVDCACLWSAALPQRGSDHVPVRACLKPREVHDRGRMQRWITSHPTFIRLLQDDLANFRFSVDPDLARVEYKAVAWSAYFDARYILSHAEASLPSEKLHWALVSYRSLRDGRLYELESAVRRWSPLLRRWEELGPSTALLDVLSEMIRSLSLRQVDDDIKDIEQAREHAVATLDLERGEHYRRELIRSRARRDRWVRRHRRIMLASIRRPDGGVAGTSEESAQLLFDHWSRIAVAPAMDMSHLQDMLQFARVLPQGFAAHISKDDFAGRLALRRHCTPGPDGIPYSVWQSGGLLAIDILYNAYRHYLSLGQCPQSFGNSLLVFIPKGDPTEHEVSSLPEELRPICLADTDSKIIVDAVIQPLDSEADALLHEAQACIRGRSMIHNIWSLEAASVHLRIHGDCLERQGFLLTDFAAAFPSLIHGWLFAVLEHIGFPSGQLGFLRALYACSCGTVSIHQRSFGTFAIQRGIRQGCPASMLLFAVALDPIIRWLHSAVMRPSDTLRAYADDLGFSLADVVESLPRLGVAFHVVARLTGLNLKLSKCALIPFDEAHISFLRDVVRRCALRWGGCKVLRAARYLGVFLGPDAGSQVWELPLARIRRAALQLKAQRLGFTRATVLFQTRVAPLIAFIAQLFAPPPDACACFRMSSQLLTGAPCHAVSGAMLENGRSLGLGLDFPSLEMLSTAARFRLACSSPHLLRLVADVQHARFQEEGRIIALSHQWFEQVVAPLSFAQVHAALQIHVLQDLRARAPVHLQAAAMRVLRARRDPLHARELLLLRVRRWYPRSVLPNLELLALRLRRVSHRSTHAISFNIIRTISRGWCTSLRFRSTAPRACVFGCGGRDHFHHYIECPALWSAQLLQRLGHLIVDDEPLVRFARLALVIPRPDGTPEQWDVLAALVVDGISFAYNSRRVGSSHAESWPLVQARLAEWARRLPRVRVLLQRQI